jgi:Rrf2 family protein
MIRLSTKGRYAVRIMVYLAARKGETPTRRQEIAESEGITPDYAVQILMRLKTAGLVEGRRGARGGFVLAADPARVTVADVLRAAEGDIRLVDCDRDTECDRKATCVTRPVWERADRALREVFAGFTIGDLAAEYRRKHGRDALMFQI